MCLLHVCLGRETPWFHTAGYDNDVGTRDEYSQACAPHPREEGSLRLMETKSMARAEVNVAVDGSELGDTLRMTGGMGTRGRRQ